MPEQKDNNRFKAIDFFCGGGGMTCGLRQAGIDVIAGVDFDGNAKETYEYNNPGSTFIIKISKICGATTLKGTLVLPNMMIN